MKFVFKNITNLAPKKTFQQSVVFYLIYLAIFTCINYLFYALLHLLFPYNIPGIELRIAVPLIECLTLSLLILQAKNIIGFYYGEVDKFPLSYILLETLTLFLAMFGGILFGLLPVAVITMYPKLKKPKSILF